MAQMIEDRVVMKTLVRAITRKIRATYSLDIVDEGTELEGYAQLGIVRAAREYRDDCCTAVAVRDPRKHMYCFLRGRGYLRTQDEMRSARIVVRQRGKMKDQHRAISVGRANSVCLAELKHHRVACDEQNPTLDSVHVSDVMTQCRSVLSQRERTIFDMEYVQGMSRVAISRSTGLTPTRVHQIAGKILKKSSRLFVSN